MRPHQKHNIPRRLLDPRVEVSDVAHEVFVILKGGIVEVIESIVVKTERAYNMLREAERGYRKGATDTLERHTALRLWREALENEDAAWAEYGKKVREKLVVVTAPLTPWEAWKAALQVEDRYLRHMRTLASEGTMDRRNRHYYFKRWCEAVQASNAAEHAYDNALEMIP